MSTQCNFILNHRNAVYYSGDVISGSITLSTIKDKTVRNMRIVFLGEGKVKWSETTSTTNGSGSTSSSTTYYKSHNIYVNNETRVHGEGVLARGQYTFTFNINLPLECPTSCEGKYGHIRYVISLILDRPYRFNNVFQKPITVLQTFDLNVNPVFRIPIVAEDIGYMGCCSCSNGQIFYTFRIPFGAYAPGQIVSYVLHIQNQAMADTMGYSLVFTQKQTFIAHSPRRKERCKKFELVQQHFNEPCLRLTTRAFQGRFRIPAVTSSTIDPNAIIKFEYKLKVTIYLGGCNSNTEMKIPIVIGTRPIRESLQSEPAPAASSPAAIATAPGLEEGAAADLPPSYTDLKPPSFEEAVRSDSPFVDKDVDERHRMVGFRPLYPMYS